MKSTGSASSPPHYQNVEDESTGLPPHVTRHDKYFQGDDMALLQIEKKIFRVSTRWLRANSPTMKRLLQDTVDDNSVNGDQLTVTRVPKVEVVQFETLLNFIENGTLSDFSMPALSWVHLLAASHHLEITSIKPRAVNEVFYKHYLSLTPVQQLNLFERRAVDRVALKAAVRQLIIRAESLDAKEMALLSHSLAARMVGMRESYLRAQLQTFGTLFAASTLDALVNGWVMNG
ncbi:hypothetical protein PENSPDRAFT_646961 [Peniophora sp. CONT]|nr:hypothetical protein PENSPDRAFT_646961 [Peniophora sp. CONT]